MTLRRAAVAALAAGLLLAGCAGSPEPRFAEPSESPSSPSESARSEEPERQSPEEFIREWVDTYNDFETNGDPAELRRMGPDCRSCQELVDVVTSAYRRGGYLRSEGWEVRGPVERIHAGAQVTEMRADVLVSPSRYKASAESPVERGSGGVVTMDFVLKRDDSGWLLLDLTRRSS